MTKAIIVTGPAGCGKTLHRAALQEMFGCSAVVDSWSPSLGLVPGALHLTQHRPADALPFVSDSMECYEFNHAMRMLDEYVGEAVAR